MAPRSEGFCAEALLVTLPPSAHNDREQSRGYPDYCPVKREMMVEAAGVELFSVLITRKLLIPGIATTAKKAPLPDPLYIYCTKMFFAAESHEHLLATNGIR